jgi:hypothetical protein
MNKFYNYYRYQHLIILSKKGMMFGGLPLSKRGRGMQLFERDR